MAEGPSTSSPAVKKLKSIHQRMAEVSEEDVLRALRGEGAPVTASAATVVRVHFEVGEGQIRRDYASTRTA